MTLKGVGVHSGSPVNMTLCPADANSGVVFLRTNLPGGAEVEIPARSSSVSSTELCTVLGDPRGAGVATVEHLLAAFVGLGLDNVTVEIDGPEVPVMDGSAAVFAEAIERVGMVEQKSPRRFLKVLRPVRVEMGSAYAEFLPFDGCRLDIAIDYDCDVIGRQEIGVTVTPRSFRRDVARARTYGNMKDVERLWAAGYARGSSLENSVVISDGAILNPEGLRYRDEFVRHKVLDSLGDLALAGAPLQGIYRSYRGGHKLNAVALSTLLSQPDAWTMVSDSVSRERRAEGRGELPASLQPAYAPDTI